nr:hypothetical protein TetV2_00018 [Oceanusvirus sp.]
MGGKGKSKASAAMEEIASKSAPRPTSDILSEAREMATAMRDKLSSAESEAEAVDISSEFGGRINDAANALSNIVAGIVNMDKEPTDIVGGLQGVARVCEDLAIRYRKVDIAKSVELRKVFTDIQYGQPGGTLQLMRDIMSGVYEGDGHGTLCLREVIRIACELCEAVEALHKAIA